MRDNNPFKQDLDQLEIQSYDNQSNISNTIISNNNPNNINQVENIPFTIQRPSLDPILNISDNNNNNNNNNDSELPPAYSEYDPNPSLSQSSSPQSSTVRYQRPSIPPPSHNNNNSNNTNNTNLSPINYQRPSGPPPIGSPILPIRPDQNYTSLNSSPPVLPQRPVSPRLPPRPSSLYPGKTGATYNNLQQR
ncbi:hypothetical protein WICMUC_001365 [Wickerhamomyces mucosus]|uniref:Uncharacterized protein n=1 Tax=Wickerhamomyces mucosus TaxID=1378264 RepID=A0A9P8TH12_9ASCO|nr:hypothetical protein WICMUC_001365 [Wickerhamomyces mucosus]